MRFLSHSLSFHLLLGAFLLVPIPTIAGQVRLPEPTIVAAKDLSAVPSPSSVESVDKQPVADPNLNRVGVEKGQLERPAASAVNAPTANISGTVTDVYGDIVPGASIVLEGANPSDRQTAIAGDTGAFQFDRVTPGISYHVTVGAMGFENWSSPVVTLNPGQYLLLEGIRLKLPALISSVTVLASPEQIATEQVTIQEHQRVFGILPNFYVTYDPNPVPLTTRLKFRLAYKADTDAVTFAGVAFMATIYQAGDIPDYGQGWDAYAKRVGAGYADTTTDIFIGGAILPWLLHQDPRYFYQGTGSNRSRLQHAVFSPFVCRGDNRKPQPNYSSLGGDLASGAISNFYYPQSNRGAGLVFQGFLVTTGVRMVNGLLQEFVLRKLTPSARAQE